MISSSMPEHLGVEHAQRLLEQLLAGLIALERDYPDAMGDVCAEADRDLHLVRRADRARRRLPRFRGGRRARAPPSAGSSTSSRGRSRARTGRPGAIGEPAAIDDGPTAARSATPSSATCTCCSSATVASTGSPTASARVDHLREWAKARRPLAVGGYASSPTASRASSLLRKACSRTTRSALEREHEGEPVVHRDLTGGTGPHCLSDRNDLVPGVDQLHGDDVVTGQGLLVLRVDQPDGLVAVVGPQEQRLEHRVRVIELDQGIEVARGCAPRTQP